MGYPPRDLPVITAISSSHLPTHPLQYQNPRGMGGDTQEKRGDF